MGCAITADVGCEFGVALGEVVVGCGIAVVLVGWVVEGCGIAVVVAGGVALGEVVVGCGVAVVVVGWVIGADVVCDGSA